MLNDKRFDKRIFKGILHDMIPRRTSIEIEATGSLILALGLRYRDSSQNEIIITKGWANVSTHIYPDLNKKYGVFELAIDDRGKQNRFNSFNAQSIDYDEHKISILNYSQLIGLHSILADMQKHCALTTNSGCHVHLDLTATKKLPQYDYISLSKFFTEKCQDGSIEKIFGSKDLNKPVALGGGCDTAACGTNKSYWIKVTDTGSLEFRCGFMTFDYSTIVKWFIGVNKLLNEYEYTLKLKEQKIQRIKRKRMVQVKEASPREYTITNSATDSTHVVGDALWCLRNISNSTIDRP